MSLTEGYLRLPEVAAWLLDQGYPLGRATLRAGCLAFTRGDALGLACEAIGAGRARTYYVRPADALAFAQRKHQQIGPRGKGRPFGTVGIRRTAAEADGG